MIPELSDERTELHADKAARADGSRERRKLRALVANEPRLYRETIAAALQELEPDIEALVVDPEALDRRVERDAPDLVFCSSATPRVVDEVPIWVEVYPEDEPLLVVSIDGTRLTTIEDNGLPNLLWIVDQTKRLLRR